MHLKLHFSLILLKIGGSRKWAQKWAKIASCIFFGQILKKFLRRQHIFLKNRHADYRKDVNKKLSTLTLNNVYNHNDKRYNIVNNDNVMMV